MSECPPQNTYFGETVWLFCVLLLLTMLGRAAFVFPFSFLHNWWARNEQLTFKEMIVIWCASCTTLLTHVEQSSSSLQKGRLASPA